MLAAMKLESKSWYHDPRYLVAAFIGGVIALSLTSAIAGSSQSQTSAVSQTASAAATLQTQDVSQVSETPALPTVLPSHETSPVVTPAPKTIQQPTEKSKSETYYTNIDGNKIASPQHSPNTSISADATARHRDRDRSYSFSQHRSGTCSGHHDGVARWL